MLPQQQITLWLFQPLLKQWSNTFFGCSICLCSGASIAWSLLSWRRLCHPSIHPLLSLVAVGTFSVFLNIVNFVFYLLCPADNISGVTIFKVCAVSLYLLVQLQWMMVRFSCIQWCLIHNSIYRFVSCCIQWFIVRFTIHIIAFVCKAQCYRFQNNFSLSHVVIIVLTSISGIINCSICINVGFSIKFFCCFVLIVFKSDSINHIIINCSVINPNSSIIIIIWSVQSAIWFAGFFNRSIIFSLSIIVVLDVYNLVIISIKENLHRF